MRALATLLLALTAVLLAGPASEVRAGGLTGGNSCVTPNQGGGSLAIKSTIAAEVDAPDVDNLRAVRVTLRLERSGVVYFDRVALSVPASFVPNTHVDFICLFLPHEDNRLTNPPIEDLGRRIQQAFSLPAGVNFCITDKGISKAEALAPLPTIPGTATVATMADVGIQAVNGACSP
jgi:hypothetical protein